MVASLRGSHPLTEGHLESQPILKSFSFKVSVTSSSPYPFEHRLISTLFPLFFTRVFVNNPFVNKIQVILIDVYHLLNSLIPISLRVKDIMCYTALCNPPPKAMTSLISFLFYCSLTSTLASCDSSNTPDCLLVWNDFPPLPRYPFCNLLTFFKSLLKSHHLMRLPLSPYLIYFLKLFIVYCLSIPSQPTPLSWSPLEYNVNSLYTGIFVSFVHWCYLKFNIYFWTNESTSTIVEKSKTHAKIGDNEYRCLKNK